MTTLITAAKETNVLAAFGGRAKPKLFDDVTNEAAVVVYIAEDCGWQNGNPTVK